jgi:hypothetical protein
MALVVVLTDDRQRCVLNENVTPEHLGDVHRSLQIIERIARAVSDAHDHDPLAVSDDRTRQGSRLATGYQLPPPRGSSGLSRGGERSQNGGLQSS